MTIRANSKDYNLKLIEHLYSQLPSFTDVFTEELFYTTAIIFVLSTIVIAFILSRFITIHPCE